jgi:hypothetical protein
MALFAQKKKKLAFWQNEILSKAGEGVVLNESLSVQGACGQDGF